MGAPRQPERLTDMRQTSCNACKSTNRTTAETEYQPKPLLLLSLGLGVASLFAIALMALTSLVSPAMAESTPGTQATAPSAERQRELIRFVRQECGFCHGLQLTGGLGSPLTAQALAEQSSDALEATILYGRTGTAMPGWMPHLNESDANWIVTALMKGFPE
jgi:cytochrome c55X